jgi:hypothetical protein
MNCEEIIEEYLIRNGFDGLFNEAGQCACKLNDLFPCLDCFDECEPGYLHAAQHDDEEFRICRTKGEKRRNSNTE